MKILITGAAGYLGNALYVHLGNYNKIKLNGIDIIDSNEIKRLDVSDQIVFEECLRELSPDVIIHTAAIKDLVSCEENKTDAFRANVLSTETIVNYILDYSPKTKVIYISSDVVFDGQRGNYSPSDKPNPINWYGKTKIFSETLLKRIENSAVLRTALIIGDLQDRYKDLLDMEINHPILQNQTLLPHYVFRRLANNMEVKLPIEIISNPTPIELLIEAVDSLVHDFKPGTYHIAGSSAISRFDFAKLICAKFDFKESLVSIDDSTVVKLRPKNISLNTKTSMSKLKLGYKKWVAEKYLNKINFEKG